MNSAAGKPWLLSIARFGFCAKGAIYIAIGSLSALAAFQGRGGARDSHATINAILRQPFGRFLLIALTAGIVCYVLWRFFEAVADPAGKGTDAKGIASRARALITGVAYGGIAIAAVRALTGSGSPSGNGGDDSAQSWTATFMSTPFGPWLVTAGGVGIVAYGLYQLYRAWSGGFEKELAFSDLGAVQRRSIVRICAAGLAARGLVFCLIGVFVIQAGLEADPGEARGLSGALNSLRSQPYGKWLFATVALGLSAYGVYCCTKARYGRFVAGTPQ